MSALSGWVISFFSFRIVRIYLGNGPRLHLDVTNRWRHCDYPPDRYTLLVLCFSASKCTKFRKVFLIERFQQEGGVRVCGIALLGYFWCGIAVIFISKYGIAVFRVQAVCGKFKFHGAVVGEKIAVSRWSASFSWQEDTNPKRSP